MGPVNLKNIFLTPLSRIITPDGDVCHAMKQSDSGYSGFGEAYFSWIGLGKVKAWKRHTRMILNLVVPVGSVRFVFCTHNTSGLPEYRVETIGIDRAMRVTVPPGVWFGFQGIKEEQSLVLNIANIEHDPNEVERINVHQLNYNWANTL
jgi:dTDP-4-dehydrorhamnose 3,5-epimerase